MRYGLSFPERFNKFFFYIYAYLLFLSFLAILSMIIEIGFTLTPNYRITLGIFYLTLGIIFIADYLLKLLLSERKIFFIKRNPAYAAAHLVLLFSILFALYTHYYSKGEFFNPQDLVRPSAVLWILFRILLFSIVVSKFVRIGKIFTGMGLKPVQLLVLSFFTLIVTGTLFLLIPNAATGKLDIVDAAFTATSAVCVTGLMTKSTGGDFTLFGQLIILCLIQLGGLGIMTITAFIAQLTRRGFSITTRKIHAEVTGTFSYAEVYSIIRQIIIYTFSVEAIGSVILSIRWYQEYHAWGKAIYTGVFHAISAFCNAGFSLFNTNLETYVKDPVITLTIAILIMLGSIGYLVFHDLFLYYSNWNTRHARKLGAQTSLTLVVTISLLVLGTVLIWFLEKNHELAQFSLSQQWMIAFFQSVTTRTAGFNTMPVPTLSQATLFIMIFLMFIGGSSGSTAGGIKTSTFGVMMAQIRATILGYDEVTIFERTIPRNTIARAFSIAVVSATLVIVTLIILLTTQPFPFLNTLFEAVSAFGTVGLSTGITPQLTPLGKIIIMLLMYLGRVGPVSFFVALGEIGHKEKVVKYPDAYLMVG